MIWSRKAKPWTKAETARADRMALEIGCIFCWLEDGRRGPCENRHHIKDGQKRMGHWFTLPVCEKHHGDCHNGTFNHAKQIDTWLKVQHALNLSDELPVSKIVPRRQTAPTSWRVCPKCRSRATKIFSLSTGKYQCQICNHEYDCGVPHELVEVLSEAPVRVAE